MHIAHLSIFKKLTRKQILASVSISKPLEEMQKQLRLPVLLRLSGHTALRMHIPTPSSPCLGLCTTQRLTHALTSRRERVPGTGPGTGDAQ